MVAKFEEYGCEFRNESECEEELNDAGHSMKEVEAKHFGD